MVAQQKPIIVKTYRGSEEGAARKFQADAAKLAEQGYLPTSQSWARGSYGCLAFLMALLLCFILIGIVIFIYMLIVPPEGTLSVTYTLQQSRPASSAAVADEKVCPRCAERVKVAATVCRFCGHEFAPT